MKLLRKSLPLLTASALTLSGCGLFGNTDMNGDDSVAADSAATIDQVSSLSILITDSVNLNMAAPPNAVAAQFAANGTAANLMNADCLIKTVVDNVVTFTATQCQGPRYGLKDLTGVFTATYTVTGTAAPYMVTVELSGNPISVNGATVDIHASAVVMISGNGRTATVTPNNTEATGSHGNKLTHTGNYIVGWDGMCTTLNGSFSTKAGLRSWKTVIDGYKRCPKTCPDVGGSITLTGNFHVTRLSFTGSNLANKTIDNKPSGTFSLGCP